MQRFRPRYYEKFVCTADQCPRTCCQEWKIPVDEATEERWRKLAPPQAVKPQRKALSAYIIAVSYTHLRAGAFHLGKYVPAGSAGRLYRRDWY